MSVVSAPKFKAYLQDVDERSSVASHAATHTATHNATHNATHPATQTATHTAQHTATLTATLPVTPGLSSTSCKQALNFGVDTT